MFRNLGISMILEVSKVSIVLGFLEPDSFWKIYFDDFNSIGIVLEDFDSCGILGDLDSPEGFHSVDILEVLEFLEVSIVLEFVKVLKD